MRWSRSLVLMTLLDLALAAGARVRHRWHRHYEGQRHPRHRFGDAIERKDKQ